MELDLGVPVNGPWPRCGLTSQLQAHQLILDSEEEDPCQDEESGKVRATFCNGKVDQALHIGLV